MLQKILFSTILFFLFIGTLIAQPKKVVLIEEATGTWCAWCPMGKVIGEKLLHDYEGEIIFIEVHGNDPMENEEYIDSSRFFSYPSGHINRNTKPFFRTKLITQNYKDYTYNYKIRYHDSNDDNYKIESVDPLPEWLKFERGNIGFAELKGIPEDTGTYEVTLRLTDTEYTIDQSFQIVVKDSILPPVSRVTKDFLILPNPNDGTFDLEFDKGTHYQVFDSSRKKVGEGNLLRNRQDKFFIQSIDLGDLNSGLYFLKDFDSRNYINIKKMFVLKK